MYTYAAGVRRRAASMYMYTNIDYKRGRRERMDEQRPGQVGALFDDTPFREI